MESLPERLNLSAYCLDDNLHIRPDKLAMLFVDGQEVQRYSFREVRHCVMALAHRLLCAGAQPEQRVVLRLPNTPMYAFAFLAVAAAGLVAVPVSPQLTAQEVSYLLEDSAASWILTTASLQEQDQRPASSETLLLPDIASELAMDQELSQAVATSSAAPAYLVYTSGSTGQPKGVLHAHRSVWGRRPMRAGWTDLQTDDVVLHAGQLNWTYTMGVGVLDPWSVGATSVLYNGPKDPQVWSQLLKQHGVTVFAAVPSLYRQILKYAASGLSDIRLRHCLTAGEALRPALLEQWQQATGAPLYEALGMSECSTYISNGPLQPIRPGSPGKPQPGRRVAVLPMEGGQEPLPVGETGLLAVHRSDPGLMLGYWHRPSEEAEVFRGEWFVGGDIAHMDDAGYVWFHGRNNDLMNAFGYRVSPLEIEQVLEAHPNIREAGVTELQVRPDVSVICAWIVSNHQEEPNPQELVRWCQSRLAAYKCPREVRWVQQLPRTRSGKLERYALPQVAFERAVALT